MNRWDGANWNWADQGIPGGNAVPGAPSAITVMDTPLSSQRPYAFVGGSDGHLWVNWWDGANWNWADQGIPGGNRKALGEPSAITVMDTPISSQRPYAFGSASDGHLWVNWWS